MSTLAGRYFSTQAADLGVTLPPILLGAPAALIDPAKRLSIHLADSIDHHALPNEIQGATRDHVRVIGDYLMNAASIAYPDVNYVDAESTRMRSGIHPALGFLEAFTPAQKKLKTGHLRNFLAEVIMPNEIPQEIRDGLLRKVAQYKRHPTEYMAYLMTTAELFAGKNHGKLGNISCIAVTGSGEATATAPFARIRRPPISVSLPLTTNETLAFMALQESSAIAHHVQAQAMQHPYSGGLMR